MKPPLPEMLPQKKQPPEINYSPTLTNLGETALHIIKEPPEPINKKPKYEILKDPEHTKQVTVLIPSPTGESKYTTRKVYRIRALTSFQCVPIRRDKGPFNSYQVVAGELGGWIQAEENLSHQGTCWVGENAVVCGKTLVQDDVLVLDNAEIVGPMFDTAEEMKNEIKLYGEAQVMDNVKITALKAEIRDKATIRDFVHIDACVRIAGSSVIQHYATIKDDGKAKKDWAVEISGSNVTISDNVYILGGAVRVLCNAHIMGRAQLYDHALISDSAVVCGYAVIRDGCVIRDFAVVGSAADNSDSRDIKNRYMGMVELSGDCFIHGNAVISGWTTLRGNIEVYGEARVVGGGSPKNRVFLQGDICIHDKAVINAFVDTMNGFDSDKPKPINLIFKDDNPHTICGKALIVPGPYSAIFSTVEDYAVYVINKTNKCADNKGNEYPLEYLMDLINAIKKGDKKNAEVKVDERNE